MRDWLETASPDQLVELQRLIDASAPPAPAPRGLICRTLAEVAEWFGLELQTVKQWRSSGCPGVEGAYDVQQIARWRVAKGQNNSPPRDLSVKQRLEEQSLELNNARLEVRLRRESGELVSRSAAKAAIQQMFARLKGQLETLPDQLAPLVAQDVRADFRLDAQTRIRTLLQQLANWRFERDVADKHAVEVEENAPQPDAGS